MSEEIRDKLYLLKQVSLEKGETHRMIKLLEESYGDYLSEDVQKFVEERVNEYWEDYKEELLKFEQFIKDKLKRLQQ